MTKEQLAKLPKWAQKEFSALQKEVESLREFYKAHQGEVEGERGIIVGVYGRTPMKFKPTKTIRMYFSENGLNYINFNMTDDSVDVYTGGVLNIKPAASNHIVLSLD